MRHAQHLPCARELGELFRHALGSPARNAGVDLVEHHRHHAVLLGQHVFECQHDARQLAAGRDLLDGAQRLAHIGGHQKRHGVHTVLAHVLFLKVDGKAELRHIELAQFPGNTLLKLLCRRVTAVGEGLRRFARGLFLLFECLLELLRTVVCILDAVQFLTRFFKICKHLLDA